LPTDNAYIGPNHLFPLSLNIGDQSFDLALLAGNDFFFRKAHRSFSSLAWSAEDNLMYFKKAFSVLWPVIAMMVSVGVPSRNSLVAKLLRAVWVVSSSHFFPKAYCFFSSLAWSAEDNFIYLRKAFSLWPVIAMMVSVGVPSRNSLVAKLHRAVWVVRNSHFGFLDHFI
jgi:hypothetical protein